MLLKIGDNTLSLREVEAQIPQGVLPADSVNLFNAIVDGWIHNELLSSFAEEHLGDTGEIDRMVENYRRKLIVQEYLKRMRESQKMNVDEKEVREYYENHKKSLVSEMPLVKGVFIKISSSAEGKEEIEHLLSMDSPESVDILEENWLDEALDYDYFKDRWVDWESVSSLIPYRFGDADKFLSANKIFHTDYGDCSYYLQISEYLPSGEIQPYEYASEWIESLLGRVDLNLYETTLVSSLIEEAIKENKLQMIGYDPIKHEMIESSKEINK